MEYKQMLDISPIGMGHISCDRSILYVNQAFCDFLGYSSHELLSKKITDITHPDDIEETVAYLDRLCRDEIAKYRIKKRYIHKSGKVIWGDLFLARNKEEQAHSSFSVLAMIMDITELRDNGVRLRRTNANFKAMFMNNPQPMGIYSVQSLNILMVNLASIRLFGYSNKEFLQLRIPDLIIDNESRLRDYLTVYQDKMVHGCVWNVKTKSGDQRIIEVHSHQILYKGTIARHFVFIDITDRIHNEVALIKNRDFINQAQVIANMGSYEYDFEKDKAVWSKNMFRILNIDPRKTDLSYEFFRSLIHPDDRRFLGMLRDPSIGMARRKVVEMRMLLPNGNTMWVVNHMEPVFKNHQLAALRGVLIDISERKEKEKDVLKLYNAVEQSPVLIVITDASEIIIYVNVWFTKISGYTREEIVGQPYSVLVSDTSPGSLYDKVSKTVRSGHIWKGELKWYKKSGKAIWENRSISPLVDNEGNTVNYLIIGEDITLRKKIEEELIEAKEKAEESVRLKSSFLAIASHELRTPLNPIIGLSRLLMNELKEPKASELAGMINQSGEAMLELIEDLFDLSLTNGGSISCNKNPISCGDLFTLARSSLEGRLLRSGKWRKIRLIFTADPFTPVEEVVLDSLKVLNILSILYNNAVKFTLNGEIELGMKVMQGAQSVQFYVRDTGIGIEEAKRDLIFDEFRQANDTSCRNYGGLGIGLAIAKQMVSILGGEIRLESTIGVGSTFFVTIPAEYRVLEPREVSKELLPEEVVAKLKDKTILVVDNNPFVFKSIRYFLGEIPLNIIAVSNGAEVIERVEKQLPDFIFIDILMPGLNGIETIRYIRSIYPQIPLFALMTYFMPRDRRNALEAGCDGIITKPVQRNILYGIIKKYLPVEVA